MGMGSGHGMGLLRNEESQKSKISHKDAKAQSQLPNLKRVFLGVLRVFARKHTFYETIKLGGFGDTPNLLTLKVL